MSEFERLLSDMMRPAGRVPRTVILTDAAFDALQAEHPTLEQVRAAWPRFAQLPDRIVAHPSGRTMESQA